MWQAITDILTSNNAFPTIFLIAFLIVVGAILSKMGLLTITTGKVNIGSVRTNEREIIRRQMEWVKIHLDGLENTLPKDDDYNVYRGKYITHMVLEEYMRWITLNHITTDAEYVERQQETIVSLIFSLTERKEFRTKKFKTFLENDVKDCIEKLVEIRESYGKRG